jgi:hypothetical protein
MNSMDLVHVYVPVHVNKTAKYSDQSNFVSRREGGSVP